MTAAVRVVNPTTGVELLGPATGHDVIVADYFHWLPGLDVLVRSTRPGEPAVEALWPLTWIVDVTEPACRACGAVTPSTRRGQTTCTGCSSAAGIGSLRRWPA